ncbi:MAG: YqgE/AlgH family protein [Propionibacteriaceae bacterium]
MARNSRSVRAELTREPLPGDLLISSVAHHDPVFDGAVILLLDKDGDGALGVVLNQCSDLDLEAVLPEWAPYVSTPGGLFKGGPVGTDSAVCLASLAPGMIMPEGFRPVFADVGLVLVDQPQNQINGYDQIRFYTGFVGWGPGQLGDEIDRGEWYIQPAQPADVFCQDPESLWRCVLRRIPGEASFFSTWTPHPELN